jgi:hypothetical protein
VCEKIGFETEKPNDSDELQCFFRMAKALHQIAEQQERALAHHATAGLLMLLWWVSREDN